MKSQALIDQYLDELIAKAVSYSDDYMDILKEIKFSSRGFKAIEAKAKKEWDKQEDKKIPLSEFIIAGIKSKYNTTNEELLADFNKYLSSGSQYKRIEHTKDILDRQTEDEARAQEQYTKPAPSDYDEGLLTLFSDIINERNFDSDEEVIRQWHEFKNKISARENKRSQSQRLKDNESMREIGVKDAKKRARKAKADKKLLAALKSNKSNKSKELWTEYLKVSPPNITFQLARLIGSINDKELGAKRINKFINEVLPTTSISLEEQKEVEGKLTEITTALFEEAKEGAKERIADASGKTSTALLAKSEGNAIGKLSKLNRKSQLVIKYSSARRDVLPALNLNILQILNFLNLIFKMNLGLQQVVEH